MDLASFLIPLGGRATAPTVEEQRIATSGDDGADAARIRRHERDVMVLSGQLPAGADELPTISEYRLAAWPSGPGR